MIRLGMYNNSVDNITIIMGSPKKASHNTYCMNDLYQLNVFVRIATLIFM
ncbi:MAG: hypothetical protein K0R46_2806 [Herbinix sp.]|jgi:hypothetical protein|nr:hypothetical protein [Herbinix sp.]